MSLKPCPLCGSTDIKLYTTESRRSYRRGTVRCQNCGCTVTAEGEYMPSNGLDDYKYRRNRSLETAKERVAEKWNKRPREEVMGDLLCEMAADFRAVAYDDDNQYYMEAADDYDAKIKLLDIH